MMYFNENTLVYLDGQFIKASETSVSPYVQTMHYGYGAFEGIRSYATPEGNLIYKAKEHYQRLRHSCNLLHIPFPYEVEELMQATEELLRLNNISDAYIRPLVYTDLNMSLHRSSKAHIFIAAWVWDSYFDNHLLRLCISPYQRPNPHSTHIEAKACGHYINSILATIDAKEKGFDEALLLDARGFVAEGPGANLFMEKEGCLYTPPPGNILPGITRATVLEIGDALGITCKEQLFTADELKKADSAFYCGTAAEVVGIAQVDQYTFPLSWAQSIGKRIGDTYRQWVRKKSLHKMENTGS